ncbi:MAG TPA: class I SAM-dependent methyltransferase [Rudaea sp.]|nr:class I SAM-dependent methyltransferase [Rudaea sp.]
MPPSGLLYPGRDLEAMSFARNYHEWVLAEIAPWLKGKVAEIGAGAGNFSRLLLGLPTVTSLFAFEPSKNMYALLRDSLAEEPNARTFPVTLDEACAEHRGEFDAITYINVLEHIEDDAQQLRFAWDTLKPGGHLLVFVPALPWLYSDHDRRIGHYRRYRAAPLRELVSAQGFEIVRQKWFDCAGILPWYVAFVLLKRSVGTGSVSAYDNLVVPLMRRVEARFAPPIGKNILLVARKN